MHKSLRLMPVARQIQRQLLRLQFQRVYNQHLRYIEVAHVHDIFSARWNRLHLAYGRGWQLAANRLKEELEEVLKQLNTSVNLLMCQKPEPPLPSPDALHAELVQLEDEFESVKFDPRAQCITVQTDSITLEEIELGPFAIELHVDRLSRVADSTCFDCKALEPNEASTNGSVTHPHVKDDQVCAGDATLPISQALLQGRICDAFVLINSVLHTYNSYSPYVSLEEWDGVSCHDCGCSISGDEVRYCDACSRDFCDDCMGTCDVCENSYCHGCLEWHAQSERSCCPSCLENIRGEEESNSNQENQDEQSPEQPAAESTPASQPVVAGA